MASLLPKFGRHLMRDVRLYQEVHGDISDTLMTAIMDMGANGMLVDQYEDSAAKRVAGQDRHITQGGDQSGW